MRQIDWPFGLAMLAGLIIVIACGEDADPVAPAPDPEVFVWHTGVRLTVNDSLTFEFTTCDGADCDPEWHEVVIEIPPQVVLQVDTVPSGDTIRLVGPVRYDGSAYEDAIRAVYRGYCEGGRELHQRSLEGHHKRAIPIVQRTHGTIVQPLGCGP